jgi:hypothetical protein
MPVARKGSSGLPIDLSLVEFLKLKKNKKLNKNKAKITKKIENNLNEELCLKNPLLIRFYCLKKTVKVKTYN